MLPLHSKHRRILASFHAIFLPSASSRPHHSSSTKDPPPPPRGPLGLSRTLQQPLPLDGLGEDLPLQPHLVAVVEVLGQLHALAQHALQAVVHRRKVAVPVLVVAPAVELLNALPEGALLRLEVPRPRIDVWSKRGRRLIPAASSSSQFPASIVVTSQLLIMDRLFP